MRAKEIGTFVLLLTLALVCALLLPVAALAETTITDDQNFQGTYEIRNAEKIAAGTTYIGNMGSIAHISKSGVTSLGTPQLLIGSAGGTSNITAIGFGWTNEALNNAPVVIGEICQSGSWPTVGDFFVATRGTLTDVAPTERMRVTYDGKVVTRGTGMVINEDGADADLRVEGDTNANLLFVDASTDRVGIGTNTPSVQLHNTGDFITMGPYADVRGYSSFANAITTIGSASKTLLISTHQDVGVNVTVPANVHLMFLMGGVLHVASGFTVTIQGSLTAPIAQIFEFTAGGTTPVKFGASTPTQYYQKNYVDKVYPQWWGAKADFVNNDTAAIQAAIDSYQTNTGSTFANGNLYPTGGTVFFPVGVYQTRATINLRPFQELAGASCRGAIIRQDNSQAPVDSPVLKGVDASGVYIHDLTIETYTSPGTSKNHGIALSKTEGCGMKFILERLMFSKCYDGINLYGETVGSKISDIYMYQVGNTGINAADTDSMSINSTRFDTIYICEPGAGGIHITGAGMCTFDNVVTEKTHTDAFKLKASAYCAFDGLYIGDAVCQTSGHALNIIMSNNNTFSGVDIGGGAGCQDAICLNGSYANTFHGVITSGIFNNYTIEWANSFSMYYPKSDSFVTSTGPNELQSNIFNSVVQTWGGEMGFCNDRTYVVMQDSAAIGDASYYALPVRPHSIQGDNVSIRTTNVPPSGVGGVNYYGYPDTDALERWTFFRNFPGVADYGLMARNATNVIGAFPSTHTYNTELITGDSSNFDTSGVGSWVQHAGSVTRVTPGDGGTGGCMKVTNSGAGGTAKLNVSTTANKLYKLTFRFKSNSSTTNAYVEVFASGQSNPALARSRKLTVNVNDWREETLYLTATDASIWIYCYVGDVANASFDTFSMREIKSAGSLQLTGGRQTGPSTVGGGGTVSLYGSDHASKPGATELDGTSTSVLVGGTEYMKFTSSGCVLNETGANADLRVEGDTNANLLVVDASADKVGIGTATPSSTLSVAGSISTTVTPNLTTNTTLWSGNSEVFVYAAGGAITVTLPAASTAVGRVYHVYKTDSSANAVTVQAAGTDAINGGTSISTTTQWKCIRIISRISGYWVASIY